MTPAQRSEFIAELRGRLLEVFAQSRQRDLAGQDPVRDDAARGRWSEQALRWAAEFVDRIAAVEIAKNGSPTEPRAGVRK